MRVPTPKQAKVLLTLYHYGPLTPVQIGEKCSYNRARASSWASQAIKALFQDELLRKNGDWDYDLTFKGKRTAKDLDDHDI